MPRLRSLSRLSLAVLLLAALGSVAWAKPKVAVLGLEASNSGVVEPKDAANAAKLTEELRAIPRGGVGGYLRPPLTELPAYAMRDGGADLLQP